MNLIGSVNIQMAETHREILIAFAAPRTNKVAMEAAKNEIENHIKGPITHVGRVAPEYGSNVWGVQSGFATVAWVTMNEVTVPG